MRIHGRTAPILAFVASSAFAAGEECKQPLTSHSFVIFKAIKSPEKDPKKRKVYETLERNESAPTLWIANGAVVEETQAKLTTPRCEIEWHYMPEHYSFATIFWPGQTIPMKVLSVSGDEVSLQPASGQMLSSTEAGKKWAGSQWQSLKMKCKGVSSYADLQKVWSGTLETADCFEKTGKIPSENKKTSVNINAPSIKSGARKTEVK